MSEPTSIPTAAIPAAASSPAEELSCLWQLGQRPDVHAFLARAGALPPHQLAAVLLADLRQRWQHGERVGVEDHLRAYPALREDPEAALDLIYGEYLLRQEHGETAGLGAFGQRFPEHAERLRVQVELRQAVDAGADTTAEGTGREAAAPPGEWPAVPGYTIEGVLGRGGMGVVYKARQVAADRAVALKMILHGGHADAEARARFRTEAQAVARLQHPHIVQIHDVGEHAGVPFFSLELCPGGSLDKKLAGTPLPPQQAAVLTEQLARAMQAAHQKGILHRDLKPANVLLTEDGTPKVTDFGMAKKLGEAGQTATGMVLGTPSYMAPEQARAEGEAVGPAADVYALGAILYECLTGRPPFKGPTPLETVLMVLHDEPVPPTRLSPKLPRDLETICLKCLHKTPAQRYDSAAALAEDLGRFLAGRPVVARPVSAAGRAWRWARRNPGWAMALASTAALLLVMAIGSTVAAAWFAEERSKARAAETQANEDRQAAEANQQRAEKAEEQAREEAAIAQAVNEFLQKDLLGQADIGNQTPTGGAAGRNPNISVGELLDRAATAVEGKFARQPLTEAAIRLTLGDTYRALGRYPEAQLHLERSMRLRSDRLGASHHDTLDSKNSLVVLYKAQGKYKEAETLCQEVIAGNSSQLGAQHATTLANKGNLAELYYAQSKFVQAEPLYQEVLAARTALLGPKHPDTLNTKHNLAILYRAQRNYILAEPLYLEALEGYAARLGDDHPDTLTCKNDLAMLYRAQGKYNQAEPLLQDVLAVRTAKLGPKHPDTLFSKNNLAMLYRAQRKFNPAEQLYQEAIEGRTAQLGPKHPDTLTTKNNLAVLYKDQRKYKQAEPLYQEVLDGYNTTLGPNHHYALIARSNLAMMYDEQGKYDLAEPLCRENVAGARWTLSLEHPNTRMYIRQLIYCHEQMDRPAQAEPLYRELADFMKQKAGPDSLAYADELAELGGNLLRQQRFAEAEACLRDALAICEQKRPDDWMTYYTRSLLGAALVGRKQYAEAEPLLVQGYEGLKQREAKIRTYAAVRLREALERLVQLYAAWDKEEKAELWRKKLEEMKAAQKPTAKP
jgi:tRNA A-37 threonylcarbamoyl transferase component Bud32